MGRTLRFAAVAVVGLAVIAGDAAAQQSRVFVTSTSSNGNLGGLTGADQECEARATAGGLGGGPWVAWLSTSTVNAVDRLTPGSGPFVRAVSGVLIANDIADLTDGSIANPILETETGVLCGGLRVFTGTLADGTVDAGFTCNDWLSASGFGLEGECDFSDELWTEGCQCDCGEDQPIFCFEASTPVPTAPPPALALLALLLAGAGAAYLHRRRRPAR